MTNSYLSRVCLYSPGDIPICLLKNFPKACLGTVCSNAIGGVINILTKQQREYGVNTHIRAMYGSYSTLTTQATNSIRFGQFNCVVSLGYNRSDGRRDNMEYEQYSGYAKVGYDFTRNWKSSVDFNLSKAYIRIPCPWTRRC